MDRMEDIWPQDHWRVPQALLTLAVQQGDGLVVTCRMLVYEALPQALALRAVPSATGWPGSGRASHPG
jgi:hypothetical protein